MNAQAQKVENAIRKYHDLYGKGIKRYLDKVEAASKTVTITINSAELEMLKMYVSNRIGQLHNDWYEATHDEAISENDLAYDLSQIALHEEQVQTLYTKLTK